MWSNATTISPVEKIGLMPELDGREEIRPLSEGVSSRFQCYLDQDWRFGEIEADARRRSGHNYSGMLHKSVAETILRAAYDLEEAFVKAHSGALGPQSVISGDHGRCSATLQTSGSV
jgi:hypothetical protein